MTVHALPIVKLADRVTALLAICDALDQLDPLPESRHLADLHNAATTGTIDRAVLAALDALATYADHVASPPAHDGRILMFPSRQASPTP